MKRKEIKKLLGLVATATVITGCGVDTAQTPQPTEASIEVKAEESSEEITEEIASEPEPTPTSIPSYTVSFENSANESVDAKEGEEAEIPEYKGIKLTDKIDFFAISVDDEGYYCIGGNRVCSADTAEIDEDAKTINLKNLNISYEVRYAVNTEDDTVYPVQLIEKEEPTNSGICVLLTYEDKEDGTRVYAFEGITDMIGRPIDNAEIYRGVFKGWSEEQSATEAEYEVGDKIGISKNFTLYPVFETEGMNELAVGEGSEFASITDDTKGIVATTKWGNISVNDKNRVITDQASSKVDQESGKVYAKETTPASSANENPKPGDNTNGTDTTYQGGDAEQTNYWGGEIITAEDWAEAANKTYSYCDMKWE